VPCQNPEPWQKSPAGVAQDPEPPGEEHVVVVPADAEPGALGRGVVGGARHLGAEVEDGLELGRADLGEVRVVAALVEEDPDPERLPGPLAVAEEAIVVVAVAAVHEQPDAVRGVPLARLLGGVGVRAAVVVEHPNAEVGVALRLAERAVGVRAAPEVEQHPDPVPP